MSTVAAPESFVFEYDPGTIHFGRGCVSELGAELRDGGHSHVLVVCGTNVGSESAIMDPVTAAVGDRGVGVFDETTPEKRIDTAVAGAARMAGDDVDALVAIGGGSTFDIARAMAVLDASDRSPADPAALDELPTPGPADRIVPLYLVPTTLAGADLSMLGGARYRHEPIRPPTGAGRTHVVADERLLPRAACYDPDLFATTPRSVLVGSAMNGFDKGIETLYSRYDDPITDATSVRGLRLLARSLPRLGADEDAVLDEVVAGTILVQFGFSTPRHDKFSIIHGFAHGFSVEYDVQQGQVHGILAPPVLESLLASVDARRDQLAEGLGVEVAGRTDAQVAEGIVDTVRRVRDELGTMTQLREIPGLERGHLPRIAEVIDDDPCLSNGPVDYDPSVAEIRTLLEDIW